MNLTNETELRDAARTCKGLFLWIDQQMKSYDLKAVTGTNWARACKKLFGFDDPGWEQKDPSEMDLDLLCNRAMKSGMKAVSVKTYKTKAKEAIKHFAKFQENPSAYKPPVFKGKRSQDNALSLPQAAAFVPIESSPAVPTQSISMSDQQHYQYSLTFNITLPPPTRKD